MASYVQSITKKGKRIRSAKFHTLCADQNFVPTRVEGLLKYLGYSHNPEYWLFFSTLVELEGDKHHAH